MASRGPRKVKVMSLVRLGTNISKTAGDFATIVNLYVVRQCVRSAILVTAWLLVIFCLRLSNYSSRCLYTCILYRIVAANYVTSILFPTIVCDAQCNNRCIRSYYVACVRLYVAFACIDWKIAEDF